MNRVALVTGASKGLGAASARLLASQGFDLVVNYHSDHKAAEAVVHEIQGDTAHKAAAVQADVTVEAEVEELFKTIKSEFGRLDVLVSNAAFPYVQKPIADMTLSEFELKVQAEIRAAFLLTREAVPIMTAQRWGRLIYISSDHADGPSAPNMASHGTSKAAVNAFAKYVAHEVGRRQITSNVVQSGLMRTAQSADMPEDYREAFRARIPVGFIAVGADVAAAVAFFASEQSHFITGTVLPANGGMGLSQFCPPDPAPGENA